MRGALMTKRAQGMAALWMAILAMAAIPAFAVPPIATEKRPVVVYPRSPGKPTAPVEIDYRLLGTPAVGQPLQIEVRVSSRVQGSRAVARLHPGPALRLESSALLQATGEDGMQRVIQITPQQGGRAYLSVHAEVEVDGIIQGRSVSIPILVGDASGTAPTPGLLTTDAAGAAIISMPADEP